MKTAGSRPPIDARILGFDREVHGNDRGEVLHVQAVYLFDAAAVDQDGYTLFPVRSWITFAEGLPKHRREQLARRYSINDEAPRRFPVAEIQGLVRVAAARNYCPHGTTGVEYDEASYEDQIEGLIEHYRATPLVAKVS